MMKSSNVNSVIDVTPIPDKSPPVTNLGEDTENEISLLKQVADKSSPSYEFSAKFLNNNNTNMQNDSPPKYSQVSAEENMEDDQTPSSSSISLASVQLSAGLLRICEPPLIKARGHLKELIAKQNKIYIDLSAEKFKLDNADIVRLQNMMTDVKIYKEKLVKIKKQMQNIYQRTKNLKKRAMNIQASKQKELQRKLQKQQLEESLIGKQQSAPSGSTGSMAATPTQSIHDQLANS